MLDAIRDRTEEIEFSGRTDSVDVNDVLQDLDKATPEPDGLLVFTAPYGTVPDDLIKLGMPIVAVNRLLTGCATQNFYPFKDKPILTSVLPAHCDKDPAVYEHRMADIADKLKTVSAFARMKNARILVVTDKPPLGAFEPSKHQFESDRKEYEDTYVQNVKQVFDAELVNIPQETLFEKIQSADEDQATQIAERWLREAIGMRGTNRSEVINSAKLYLAMKELMQENRCNAITTEGFGWPPLGYKAAAERNIPSQGIATSQLLTDGVPSASETLIDCLITQQLALYMTGSGGLLGDYNIDPLNKTAVVCHCEGTFKPYNDNRRSPYVLRNLPFFPEKTGGTCAEVHYPIGETVTLAKISMYKKKISLSTGTTVSGEELFPYWNDILGRNKIAVRTDAEKLFENVDWKTFGHHRVAFFGDFRQQFKDLAKLIGFDIVEKDR
ncbi:MAG: hypothetical protein K9N51_08120 [Candidatus Pacebacteria bacterium]|nr:hypothetical protein [Candidatus Paceibacterota bacterium]